MDELARRREQRLAEQAAEPLASVIEDLGVARGFIVEAEAAVREEGSSALTAVVTAARRATEAALALVKEETL